MTSRSVPLSALPASVRAKLPKRNTGAKREATENAKRLEQAKRDAARESFYAMLRRAKLPIPLTEVRFDDTRMWRFDYAWELPWCKVALEVDGGIWTQGRHTRGAGYLRDIDKLNTATSQGWKVFRTTPDRLTSRSVETLLRRALTFGAIKG